MILYNDEQQAVINNVLNDIKVKQIVSIAGYAGTGKTTIIKEILSKLPNFRVCAFTGKATNILRRKGIHSAETIHSTIYDVKKDEDKVKYSIKPFSKLLLDGFIIDEASMISEEIYKDLCYYEKPIIFVGDHGQLPPIGKTNFNIMSKPDYKLETIHRNAGPIARFANYLRESNNARNYTEKSEEVTIRTKSQLTIKDLLLVDQVICAFNKTRVVLNVKMREALKLPPEPVVGDKIIVLRNNRNFGVFNGQQGVVSKINNKTVDVQFDNFLAKRLPYTKDLFNAEKTNQDTLNDYKKDIVLMDYAYAITCHKAQGDQFDKIAVLEEPCTIWEMNRWNYTAASRAETQIFWYK
jgi:exodeoxyribonuclease-5